MDSDSDSEDIPVISASFAVKPSKSSKSEIEARKNFPGMVTINPHRMAPQWNDIGSGHLTRVFPELADYEALRPLISSEFINELVSADEIWRGKHGRGVGWLLLDELELFRFMLHYRHARLTTLMPMANCEPYYHKQHLSTIYNPQFVRQCLAISYPIIDRILLLGDGHLLLAGGACVNFVYTLVSRYDDLPSIYRYIGVKDLDFFFVGFNPENQARATALLEDLINILGSDFDLLKADYPDLFNGFDHLRFSISRNSTVVNVKTAMRFESNEGSYNLKEVNLQFILRLYPDTGDVIRNISLPLGGFDLYGSAIGYYIAPGQTKGKFYSTLAGAFANSCGLNIINSSRVSPSYRTRLSKYSHKGFRILLPGTSREKLLSVSAMNIAAWKSNYPYYDVNLPNLRIIRQTAQAEGEARSDYGEQTTSAFLPAVNLGLILAGYPEQYCVSGRNWQELLNPKRRFFSSVSEKPLKKNYLKDRLQMIVDGNRRMEGHDTREGLPFGAVDVIYNERSRLRKVFKSFIRQRLLSDGQVRSEDEITDAVKRELERLLCLGHQELEAYCDSVYNDLEKIVVDAENRQLDQLRGKIEWKTKNPLSQHTSSFNPTFTTAREWWGEKYYVPFRVGFPDQIYLILKRVCTTGIGKCIGECTFRQLLVPYFAQAWAAGIFEKLMNPAIRHYKLNAQCYYANMAFSASLKMVRDYNETPPDQIGVPILPEYLPAELNHGENAVRLMAWSSSTQKEFILGQPDE